MASNRIGLHTTRIHGRTVMRICTINPRTTPEDEDILLEVLHGALHATLTGTNAFAGTADQA